MEKTTQKSELLNAATRSLLPPLYAQEKMDDPIVYAKFFTPSSNWTWYVTEFDGEDTFFGLVVGFETELGYFSLSEMESINGRVWVARDLNFTPTPLSEVRQNLT